MSSEQPTNHPEAGRVEIINAVKTPLSFFVLVVIVVEAGLGGLAMKSEARNQLIIVYLMVAVIAALIAAVVVLTYKRPWDLLGTRRSTGESREQWQALVNYCERISGAWWQQLEQDRENAISFVLVTADPELGTVSLDGRAYDREGAPVAKWDSVAVAVNLQQQTVYYFWQGHFKKDANVELEGFGTITIHAPFTYGSTKFFDTNPLVKTSIRLSGEFKRATKQQVHVVPDGPKDEVARIVREQLGVQAAKV